VLAGELRSIAPEVAEWAPFESAPTPEARLESLKAMAREVGGRIAAARADVEERLRLQAGLDEVRAELRASAALKAELELRQSTAADAVRRARDELSAANVALDGAEHDAADRQAAVESLARIAAAAEVFQAGEGQWAKASEEIDACDARLAELQVQVTERSDAVSAKLRLLETRQGVVASIERSRTLLEFAARLRVVASEIEAIRAAGEPREALDSLSSRRAALAETQEEVEREIRRLTGLLHEIDERESAIQAAAATIAARLSTDDRQCPICQTVFPLGELLQLAQAPRAAYDIGARQLGERLAGSQLERDSMVRAIAALDEEIADAYSRVTRLAAGEASFADLQAQMREAGLSTPVSSLEPAISSRLDELANELARIDIRLAAEPSLEELQGQVAELEAVARTESVRRTTGVQVRTELSVARETARARLAQHPGLWSEGEGMSERFATLNAQVAAAADATAVAVSLARAEVVRLKARLEMYGEDLDTHTAAYDEHRGRHDVLVRREADLLASWSAVGGESKPGAEAVRRERERLLQDAERVDLALATVQELAEAYRRWLHDHDLADRERMLRMRMMDADGADEAGMALRLSEAISAAEERVSRITRLRERVGEVIGRLQAEADEYAERVLRPLNDTIRDFGRVLMTRADGTVFYRAEHHASRSELRPSLIWSGGSGEPQHMEINPNLFFSEGQLSALSVSALLAASTTFPWSRWRAVLLDDPLQHNDVIHVSAFSDLLRQMVTRLEYQVILSTHDATEAAFMARKCRSAGIACRVYELRPAGSEGSVEAR